jgi:hypothetical protein
MESVLGDGRGNRGDVKDRKVEALEAKLAAKDAEVTRKEGIIANVVEEYVTFKKSAGPLS